MLNLLKAILIYYKPLALWSFIITIILTIVCPKFMAALLTKLFFLFLFWLMISDKNMRKKLKFYKMTGVSNFKLVTLLFIIDAFITCSFLILIKGFI